MFRGFHVAVVLSADLPHSLCIEVNQKLAELDPFLLLHMTRKEEKEFFLISRRGWKKQESEQERKRTSRF